MTNSKSSVMTDFVAPIGVLFLICVVMTFLLALTNGATAPVIEKAEQAAADAARKEVMPGVPDVDPFELVTEEKQVSEDKSVTVTAVYKESGKKPEDAEDTGYVFMVTAKGYGGKNTLNMVVGIKGGKITDTKVLSHSETVGLGAKITGDDFKGQFPGQDLSYVENDMDTISGATFSSNYYRAALEYTFEVYNNVKGAA